MLAEAVAPKGARSRLAFLQSVSRWADASGRDGLLVMPRLGWRFVLIASSVTALLAVFVRRSCTLPDEPAARAPSPRSPAAGFGRVLRAFVLGCQARHLLDFATRGCPAFLREEMHQGSGRC